MLKSTQKLPGTSKEKSTARAVNRLVDEVLPALQRQLLAISNKPVDQQSCDESTRHLVVEALDLFGALREWLGGGSFSDDGKSVTTSLLDGLVGHVDLLDSDQLRLQSVVNLIPENEIDGALLRELRGLASRFANDVGRVRGVVDILTQNQSSDLRRLLLEAVAENATEAGLRYEVSADFSEFDMDRGQLAGLVDALAATAQFLAVTAITAGDPFPVILMEGRKASGQIRVVGRTEIPLSTRGLNLDALAHQFALLKGSIFEGSGSVLSLVCEVPSSLRSMKGIVVKAGEENYALPVHGIIETMRLDPARIQVIGGQEFLNFRSSSLPLFRLTNILGKTSDTLTSRYALIVDSSDHRFGLMVDELIEQRDLALRPLGGTLTTRPEVVGGAVDSDGRVIMVIDPRKFHLEALKPAA